MSNSKHLNEAAISIQTRRGFSKHPQKGAIMMNVKPQIKHADKDRVFQSYKEELDFLLQDIDVYYPKNPAYFWMGKVESPHITFLHGFELQQYEVTGAGEAGLIEDVEEILDSLDKDDKAADPDRPSFRDRLFSGEIMTHPEFFNSNPTLVGEDKHYTVVLRGEPSAEMARFRAALMRVFPHTVTFSDFSIHASICTVASEEGRDRLMAKLADSKISMGPIKYGYNIAQQK